MKKIIAMFLICVMISSAAIAEIDLSTMEEYELILLREKITEELNSRKPEIQEDEEERRDRICDHFQKLSKGYNFQAIIDEINAGDSGLSSECQADMLSLASKGVSALDGLNIESDIFSGDLLIKSPLAMNIGGDISVVPYLSNGYLGLIVGFPYEDSFNYDEILLKIGGNVTSYRRKDFDIEFERIDDTSWEYTYLSYVSISEGEHLEAVGFREDDTTRKVDHIPTAVESSAVDALALVDNISYQLYERVLSWKYNPDPSEQ